MLTTILLILIKVLGMCAGFAISLTITRYYGSNFLAEYHILLNTVQLFVVVSCFGLSQFIIRKIPRLISDRNIVYYSYLKISIITVILAFTLYLLAIVTSIVFPRLLFDEFSSIAMGLIIVLMTGFTMLIELQRATDKVIISEINRQLSIKVVFIMLLFLALLSTSKNNTPYEIYLLTLISVFVINLIIDRFTFVDLKRSFRVKLRQRFIIGVGKSTFIYFQSQLLLFLQGGFTILLLSSLSDNNEVAIFILAAQLASITTVVFASGTLRIAPLIAKFHASNEQSNCGKILKQNSRLVASLTGIISVLTWFFSDFLLNLFGDEYINSTIVIEILLIGNVVNALTGPAGTVLEMVGAGSVRRNILFINTLLIVISSIILIPRFGALGLAIAIVAPNIILNTISTMYTYRRFQLKTWLH